MPASPAGATSGSTARRRRYEPAQYAIGSTSSAAPPRFEQQALQDVDPTQLPRFDKVFAINVNLFWTRPAQGELALVRQLLSDDGQLDLFYDSPTPAGTSRIAGALAEHLEEAGYAFTSVTATLGESTVIGLSCEPH